MARPTPVPDQLSHPFWDGCNQGRLLVQECKRCDRRQHPPEAVCRQCGEGDWLHWKETSGRGRIHEYTVMHDSRIVAFHELQPYNLVGIQLEEDPEVTYLSNLPGVPADQVPVGATVEVYFEQLSPSQKLPEWRVVS